MSDQVFDKGSIIRFTPERFSIETWKGDPEGPVGKWATTREKALGWGLLVTHRENWILDTEVQPMVVCCGELVPVIYHLASNHAVPGELCWWRMGVE
jgi:hypothetical protein